VQDIFFVVSPQATLNKLPKNIFILGGAILGSYRKDDMFEEVLKGSKKMMK